MRVVGLTGGIGSGKSVVARMLAELGAAIIDADQLAREAVEPGSDGLREIVARFGEEVLRPDGRLDRAKLGTIVFGDAEAREALNRIVHPRVARLALERMGALGSVPIVVYDVPLLYENGLDRDLAEVIVVDAADELRRQRIAARDHLSREEIDARMGAQMPLREKLRRANYVIDNSGSLDATRAQVASLFRRLVEGARS